MQGYEVGSVLSGFCEFGSTPPVSLVDIYCVLLPSYGGRSWVLFHVTLVHQRQLVGGNGYELGESCVADSDEGSRRRAGGREEREERGERAIPPSLSF